MTYQEYVDKILTVNAVSEAFVVGYSLLSQPIYGAHVGSFDGRQAIVQCGIHAREYITSLLGAELLKYAADHPFGGGAYFVFNANPDGVRLVLDGPSFIPCDAMRDYILGVNGGSDFSFYKANANLVDLNTNFDAYWGGGQANVRCPSPSNFIGYYPMSEREVRVLSDFTRAVSPFATLSYHTKGEVVYYGFEGQSPEDKEKDERIAFRLSAVTGYTPIETENSAGGYKDWCVDKLKIPAFTIEVAPSSATHPVGIEFLPELFEQNKNVLEALFA